MCRNLLLFLLLILCACTVQKKSVSSNSDNGNGTTTVNNGQTSQLSLWSRGPLQASGDFTLDSADALNSVARQNVSLFDLSSTQGKLEGPNLKVFYSKGSTDGPGFNSPLISSWLGKKVPWDSKEFKAFMVYAHGSRAIRYMKELYPSLSFSVRGKGLFPIYAFSSVDDTPLRTRYEINKDNRLGNILFYQEEDEDNARFNPADEADAIYHEFGHAFQHVLNPSVLENAGNYDMDMLLEALSDFFAASLARDDRILEYLSSNAKYLFSSNNRTGQSHERKMGSALYFPRNYVADFHLDARVVTNALNDLRKYLEGQSVSLLQNCGSSCTVQWNSVTQKPNKALAFDTVNVLAHNALREVVKTSSIIHYAERLVLAFNSKSWTAHCGSSSSCKSELIADVTSILKSRGLLTNRPIRCNSSGECTPFTTSGSNSELVLNHTGNMFFAPIGGSSRSNSDTQLDRCEAILAYPDISVRSTANASAFDTLFELYTENTSPTVVSGFSSLNGIDQLVMSGDVFDSSEADSKLLGFLLPGESLRNLAGLASSRYYASHQMSYLSPALGAYSSARRPPFGWALKAPASAGGVGQAEFAFSTRPYEVRYVTNSLYTIKVIKQKLTVSNPSANFCN